ncbi:trypsin-like peptidase domain-containing protein [Nostoc sp. CENA67]|uniref:Trypsin-like peptidase domain-containing protein n=1 Tax=Amazonocrinis nigriterrae CENA67 TaxID=2794033 RepID=A0A8J7LCY2_9NOST|nr:serine protease [Amazonocrinis nigriterrae]MBH8566911.1 trypsin-like peptidase domain-containing protein [Amazonocrinis nigriterrae CENA67]
MAWHRFAPIFLIGTLLTKLSASAPVESVFPECTTFGCKISQSRKLYRQAQSITVKVLSTDFLGSGILLKNQGQVYTVLTNAHVLQAGEPPYRIQTEDDKIYTAHLSHSSSLGKNDLALLQFQSTGNNYTVASLSSSLAVGDEVFAAGFLATEEGTEEQGLAFTKGKVSLMLPKPLEGGYQLGYTNDIQNGMSGGPLLNYRGEVVGVNGMHAYPLWDVPSVFQDGSNADERLHQIITRLNWAVPIDKVVQMIAKPAKTPDKPMLNKAD